MIDLKHPYQQAIAEDMRILLAARYDGVVQRLVYPELGHTAFINRIHGAAIEGSYCDTDKEGDYVVKSCDFLPFNLLNTMKTIEREQNELTKGGKAFGAYLNSFSLDLRIVKSLDEIYATEDPIGQLQYLVCIGLIGACHKPRVENVSEVMKRELPPDASPSDFIFRQAVRALVSRALKPGEEEALGKSVNKLTNQLQIEYQRDKVQSKLNRYFQGKLAGQILRGLLDPFTTRQHTMDEIDVIFNRVPPAYMPPSLPDLPVPTVALPWPILPPGEGPKREYAPRPPRIGPGRERVLDDLRIRWLGAVVARWPFGGRLTDINLHNRADDERLKAADAAAEAEESGGAAPVEIAETADEVAARKAKAKAEKEKYRNRYQAAILNGPDKYNREFAIIADTDIVIPEHGLFAAIVKRLVNAQGRRVNWRVVFRGTKGDAQSFGVRRFNHSGHDMHSRVLDYLLDEFEEQFEFRPAFLDPGQIP